MSANEGRSGKSSLSPMGASFSLCLLSLLLMVWSFWVKKTSYDSNKGVMTKHSFVMIWE